MRWRGKGVNIVLVEMLSCGDAVPSSDYAIRQLVVFGTVQVSTQALETLVVNEIPVASLTGSGRFIGTFAPAERKNVGLHAAQFRRFADPAERLALSKAVVRGDSSTSAEPDELNYFLPSS